jgi:RNase H-fold protein (predicted Holliday junction resolvase)
MLFFFYDERLSTQTVDKFLDNDMSKTRIKRKEFKDSLAAKVILDEALEWARNNNFKH